ncbi:MAG: hypothetical protein PHE24_01310 [Patescibacteria group bacterium]|nr:hypothetical protein [Patescibacteria group bacterium]
MSNLIKSFLSVNYFHWLLISMVFYAGGEFFSKKFAMGPKVSILIVVLVFYSLNVLAWLAALWNKEELAIVGTTWAVLSVMVTISIGIFIFGERLNGYGIAGIIFGVVAIALLSMA